eukprot:2258384-Amphidinium_carterae.1
MSRRSQSESAAGRPSRPRPPAPPFVPGVSYSVEELNAAPTALPNDTGLAGLVRQEQQRRLERARRNFIDRSQRDARPTPPTASLPAESIQVAAGQVQTRHVPTVVPPPKAGEVRVINTAVPVTTAQADPTATAQTSAVSHIQAASTELPSSTAPVTTAQNTAAQTPEEEAPAEQSTSYLQACMNVLMPFRANKKRAHSGSSTGLSSEVNPSPRVHLQQQEDHPMGQEDDDSTAQPVVDDDNKRLKVDESTENKPEWYLRNQEYTRAWNERQEKFYKEQEEKRAADLEGLERRLPDKMPPPRNTTIVYEDTVSTSVSQPSQESPSRETTSHNTAARFYCPCCPNWLYTPQKRYLHLALQHTVYLPQLGGKMQDDFDAEGLYVIPILNPPTVRDGNKPRIFAGHKEEKAYRNAVNNASRVPTPEQRCALWQGGKIRGDNDVPQHMDLPQTDPPTKQLASFWGKNSIKLLHTGKLIENRELEKKP